MDGQYRWGIGAQLVDRNPAKGVSAPKPVRGERILPLSIAEVDQVAEECSAWGPLVVFMADTGARPAEAVAVEWRHVDLEARTVELPGSKNGARLAHRAPDAPRRRRDPLRPAVVDDSPRVPR